MNIDELSRLLKSKSTDDRIRAAQRLARIAGPEVQPLLLEALKDKNKYVAAVSAEALGRCADLNAAAIMIERFRLLSTNGIKLDPGCHIRAHLAFALGRLEYMHADDVLRIGIRTVQIEPVGGVPYDTGAHLRANCALAMAQIRASDALRDITLLLFDDGQGQFGHGDALMAFVEPRKAAARALGMLASPEARVPLTLRLRYPWNECPEVLQQCMESLIDLEDPDAPDLLMPFVHGKDPELAVFAALMLGRARVEGAERMLREMIEKYSGNAMRGAVLALASLRTEASANELRILAQSDGSLIRDAVAELVPNLIPRS